jgi:DNA topoisomerase VI subunit B
MTILRLQAKQDALEKEASTRDPIKGIAEYVWNALDADATLITVKLEKNDLGGIVAIRVSDNGHGISQERADQDFSNLGGSLKRTTFKTRSLERAIHGKEGRGRLKFFSLARQARWLSISEIEGKRSALTLTIQANNLENCDRSDPVETSDDVGTIVELSSLKEPFDSLDTPEAFRQFSTIFAPYVLQYPDVHISFNEFEVDPRITIHRTHDIPQSPVVCPNRTIDDLRLKLLNGTRRPKAAKFFSVGTMELFLGLRRLT